jgi:hypothetical protein
MGNPCLRTADVCCGGIGCVQLMHATFFIIWYGNTDAIYIKIPPESEMIAVCTGPFLFCVCLSSSEIFVANKIKWLEVSLL